VGPGNDEITDPDAALNPPAKLPQMPTYHLTRETAAGITLVNIGVGPSNAKTATDHIAVLRPHAWLMVGHCAGLRNTQSLGDYVLAHAYLREDRVLDDDLPVWVPIPALAEVQIALEQAVADVSEVEGFDLKRIMRTGTVATSTTATGNCATRPARCSASARAAPSRSTWKAPRSPPTGSGSGCPTARFCASPTSRCTAS
jgi:AMP nucleosidase